MRVSPTNCNWRFEKVLTNITVWTRLCIHNFQGSTSIGSSDMISTRRVPTSFYPSSETGPLRRCEQSETCEIRQTLNQKSFSLNPTSKRIMYRLQDFCEFLPSPLVPMSVDSKLDLTNQQSKCRRSVAVHHICHASPRLPRIFDCRWALGQLTCQDCQCPMSSIYPPAAFAAPSLHLWLCVWAHQVRTIPAPSRPAMNGFG